MNNALIGVGLFKAATTCVRLLHMVAGEAERQQHEESTVILYVLRLCHL